MIIIDQTLRTLQRESKEDARTLYTLIEKKDHKQTQVAENLLRRIRAGDCNLEKTRTELEALIKQEITKVKLQESMLQTKITNMMM